MPTAVTPLIVLISLGITQIIGFGTLYYAFSLLAPGMATSLGWSLPQVFAAFSGALIVMGLASPAAGRLADRVGAGLVLGGGSVLAGASLALCALAPGPFLYLAGMAGVGLAAAAVLYNMAFVALVQLGDDRARGRITYLTLMAGFASTVFWPVTKALLETQDWRSIYIAYAALNLVVCAPLHLFLARETRPKPMAAPEAPKPKAGRAPTGPLFAVLFAAVALEGAVMGAVLVHMVPLIEALGLGAAAALVAALFGPAQVGVRVINMTFGARLPQTWLAIIAAGFPLAGLLVLLGFPGIAGAAAFAVLFGMGTGLISIVTGTLPLALFGADGYGSVLGRLASARLVAGAVSPFLLSVALGGLGVRPALWVAVALGAAALACFWTVRRMAPDNP